MLTYCPNCNTAYHADDDADVVRCTNDRCTVHSFDGQARAN